MPDEIEDGKDVTKEVDTSQDDKKRKLEDLSVDELVLEVRKGWSEAKGYRLEGSDLRRKLTESEGKMTRLEKTQKDRMEKQGDYESLNRQQETELEELRIKGEKADRLEKSVIARNQRQLEKLPENMRDLFPSDMSPENQSDWLDKAVPKLTAARIPDLDGGAGGHGSGGTRTPKLNSYEKDAAAKAGMTEDEWSAAKAKANL